MTVQFVVGFLIVLLVLALLAQPLSRWFRLPQSPILVLLGAVTAHAVTLGLGVDTGIRAADFHDLIFFVFLPVLVFDAAYKLPPEALRANLPAVLFMAVVGLVATTAITGVLLYYGIGHASGFPWIAALLAGALLAATDPVAVVSQLKTLGAPERLGVLLEGESLFNDATAIVVFALLLSMATMSGAEITPAGVVWQFLVTFAGGALVGAAVGGVIRFVSRALDDPITWTIATLAGAYGSFLLAEAVLHVSGVMASLVVGLLLADRAREQFDRRNVDFFWDALAFGANGSVFLLMGLTITVAMFTQRWLAMLVAIVAVFAARLATTVAGFGLLNLLPGRHTPARYQAVVVWGGLRGAVTLALALSLPVELEYWWTIQSMAFGVVLFTLLVQAPTMPWLLRRLELTQPVSAAQARGNA